MNRRILVIIALAGLIILSPYVVGEALARSDQFSTQNQFGTQQGGDCPAHDGYSQESFDITVKTWDAFHLHQDLHQTSFYTSGP